MSRLIDPKCKQCRRVGEKLFLKGERCFTPKCAMIKKAYPPGPQRKKARRGGLSEYGRQLIQKKKIKKIYGLTERQLKNYFTAARRQKGDARENLIRRLELRLDNVVFRLGWARSRSTARQLVNHGHVLVNGRRIDIPSYQLKTGDVMTLGARIIKSKFTENLLAILKKHEAPVWLAPENDKIEARVLGLPEDADLGDLAMMGLIIESYSR